MYREEMATDRLDSVGIYGGTNTGKILASKDGKKLLIYARRLLVAGVWYPPVWSSSAHDSMCDQGMGL